MEMCADYLAEGATPITPQLAKELREVVFGTAIVPIRAEWTQTPFLFGPSKGHLAYGLRSSRNATRGLLSVVQGFVVKHLLFVRRQQIGNNFADLLKPDADLQKESLIMALIEILLRVADKEKVQLVLPGPAEEEAFVPHSAEYFHDSVTEKLYLFTLSTRSDLQLFLSRHYKNFTAEDEPGTLLFLYSALLTRTLGKVRMDMDAMNSTPLITSNNEEGSLMIVTLLLTGRATPFIHNGILSVGDEKNYSVPQYGILSRCTIGLLLWDNEVSQPSTIAARQPGSRLKTPNFPIWITSCAGHYGVLFSRNAELLRNYHAEAHFDLNYYSCSGHQIAMTIDNRTHIVAALGMLERQKSTAGSGEQRGATTGCIADSQVSKSHAAAAAAAAASFHGDGKDETAMASTPLQRLIHTKWPEAQISYHAQPSMLSYLFSTNVQ